MGYLGEEIKKLGFGLMRLPQKDGKIDIEQTKEMVRFVFRGRFYIFRHRLGLCRQRRCNREALVERYPRERYQLATKNAAWIGCKTREEAIAQFDTSLKRTGAGYFDFYLLHNLGESRTHYFDDFDLWSWVWEKKREGLVKHVGFSFHSTPEELEAILTAHPEMEFVQLQINYADWENPAVQSRACYEVARKHGKPVIIMEPVKGGMLATPPASVTEILKRAEPDSSPASWAIRFAANLDGVITVLSGMSDLAQMRDNLSHMKDFTCLTKEELSTLSLAQEALRKIPLIPCTTCNYCAKVCPKNIGISGTFAALNCLTLYEDMARAKHQEEWLVSGHGKSAATDCIKCGRCEQACPQHISIRKELEKAAKEFYGKE